MKKEITVDEALSLLRLCQPGIIDKVRWLVPAGKHTFEVDEFFGDNEGLVVAEVELSHADESFEHPDFLGPGDGPTPLLQLRTPNLPIQGLARSAR